MHTVLTELITPERKRISERLKRLWNHKTMAYKVYVSIAVPKWGLGPRIILWGLKTEKSRKIAIGAYSSELIYNSGTEANF